MARTTVVPIGPQHPVLVEPIHLRFEVEEEVVVGLTPVIGYNHRGIEKLMENDWKKNNFLSERVCGICSHQHSTCYTQAVERVMGVEPPERALLIRTLLFELQRIHSHLLIIGLEADAIGYENLFMQCWRDREIVMRIVELISGNRVHYSMNQVGGVRRDIDDAKVKEIEAALAAFDVRFADLDAIMRKDPTWVKRLKGIGVLTRQQALDLGAVGPVARASGVDYDVRSTRAHPYGAYHMLKSFKPVIREDGDTWSRMMCRMEELWVTLKILREILSLMKPGPITVEVKGHPNGQAWSRVEASRGELVYFVKGTGKPALDRVKIRTPTFANIPPLVPMLMGCQVADIPPIVTAIDPCICCTDR